MKQNKSFKSYSVVWAILLVFFNIIAFLIPKEFGVNFWVSYAFITLAFIAQIGTAFFAFKEENRNKRFLNISTVYISYIALICAVVLGAVFIFVPGIPFVISVVFSFLIIAIDAIAVIGAKTAADMISATDDKIKAQTFFIKNLTADANTLLALAKSEEVKAECKKVYEAIRFSDPMSNDAVTSVESQITINFSELSNAVQDNDIEAVKTFSNDVLILLKDRNNKCGFAK